MDSSGQRGGICLYMACLQSIGVRWFLVSARTKTMSRFGALAFGFYSANLQNYPNFFRQASCKFASCHFIKLQICSCLRGLFGILQICRFPLCAAKRSAFRRPAAVCRFANLQTCARCQLARFQGLPACLRLPPVGSRSGVGGPDDGRKRGNASYNPYNL